MLEALHPQPPKPAHKDKLAATKKHDEEVHEAVRAAREAEKEKRHQAVADASKVYKMERALKVVIDPEQKHSKRAIKEQREASKKAERQDDVLICTHGVNKCRICFPPKHNKKLDHGHEKPRPEGAEAAEDDE